MNWCCQFTVEVKTRLISFLLYVWVHIILQTLNLVVLKTLTHTEAQENKHKGGLSYVSWSLILPAGFQADLKGPEMWRLLLKQVFEFHPDWRAKGILKIDRDGHF